MGTKAAPFATTIQAKSLAASPWKNGGGLTKQIAIYPAHASLEKGDFTWRLSSAQIEKPGPFSSFPDFRRFLALVKGEALTLKFPQTEKTLRRGGVIEFAGQESVTAELPEGPVTDLGIIFDPDQALVKLSVLRLENRVRSFTLTAPNVFFFVMSGELAASVYPGEKESILLPGDTLRIDPWREERIAYLDPGKGRAELVAVEIAELKVKNS